MIKEIKTVKDVIEFFHHLAEEERLSFHPDENFEDYVNMKTNKPSYTQEEAHERDALMEQCFVVCDQNNRDIYDLSLKQFYKLKQ